jgi:hypothetical protein
MNDVIKYVFTESIGILVTSLILMFIWHGARGYYYVAAAVALLGINTPSMHLIFKNWGMSTAGGTYAFPVVLGLLIMAHMQLGYDIAVRVWKTICFGLVIFMVTQLRWFWYILFYEHNASSLASGISVRNALLLLVSLYYCGGALLIALHGMKRLHASPLAQRTVLLIGANVLALPPNLWVIYENTPKAPILGELLWSTIVMRSALSVWCVLVMTLLFRLWPDRARKVHNSEPLILGGSCLVKR